ncbi:MAG TPA: hypothetical protein VGL78_04245 [Solirubrobacteraceae bacterium]|jgi:hypothetical protein
MLATREKTTPAQRQRLDALEQENPQQRFYTETVTGKSIIDQFRRYLVSENADRIRKALYEFLTGVCGFIAEFGLEPPDGGFRIKWAEPADLIEALFPSTGFSPARRGIARRVYRDGQTDVDVLKAVIDLAREHRAVCELGRRQRRYARHFDVMLALARMHGCTILPAGWRVQPGAPENRPAGGTLATRIVDLAEKNGLALIAPYDNEDSAAT